MKLSYQTEIKGKKADVLITGVYEGLKNLDEKEKEDLKALGFKGKAGEIAVLPGEAFKGVIYVGLGKKGELKPDTVRLAAAKGIKEAKKRRFRNVVCELLGAEKLKEEAARAVAEGLKLGEYEFTKYKSSEDEQFQIEKVYVAGVPEYRDAL